MSDDLAVVEEALARLAILEDVGTGDLTARIIPGTTRATATVRAKQEGVLSGLGAAVETLRAVDRSLEIETLIPAGSRFVPGAVLLKASGSARSLLTAERIVLNFLQHLSGVASMTALFVAAAGRVGTGVRITDTRKTLPGLRLLEKEAVIHGGGTNHRIGLYDAVMIKENHVAAAGGITDAVREARNAARGVPIIVEARNRSEAEEAARSGVGRILLDNMEPDAIDEAVAAVRAIEATLQAPSNEEAGLRWLPNTWREGDPLIQIEVSGNITLETIATRARPGVDFLSIGCLTHSAPAIDLSIDLERLDS